MSKESLGDLGRKINSSSTLSRRVFVAGGLGSIALGCTPSVPAATPESKVTDLSTDQRGVPTPEPSKEPNPLDPIEIQASRVKFIYPDQLSESDWTDVARGVNIPLPFGGDSFPLQAATLVRRIKASDPQYQEWVGREIVDSILGFMLGENTDIVAFTRGTVVLQPGRVTDPHTANTTRIEFRPDDNKSLVYVYRIGGRNNIEWQTMIRTSPENALQVEAGQPLGRIIKPAKVPAQFLPNIIENIPGIYDMWLTQQSTKGGIDTLNNIFREENGLVTSSQLSIASLRRGDDNKYVGLYSSANK